MDRMAMNLTSGTPVLFDWDGTLVDTIPGVLEAHNHVRAAHGLDPWTLPWFKANMRQSALKLYPEIYGDRSQAALDMLYGYIEDNHLRKLTPMKGAKDLLDALRRHRVPMALVSNKKHKYLMREVGHMGWQDHFRAAIGAGIAERDKPDPDPILKILNDCGWKAADALYVGDTETDLQASGAAGCRTVLITNAEDKGDLVKKYAPFAVMEDCEVFGRAFGV